MEILRFPNPLLFKVAQDVSVFGEELKTLLDGMWETMVASKGMGLAANQIGLPFNIFIMNTSTGRVDFINPKIVAKSQVPANMKEGCLSSPGEFLIVPDR